MAERSTGNLVLDRVPRAAMRSLLASARAESLAAGDVLFRRAEPITEVHFPVTAVASLIVTLGDGSEIEMSAIGNQGLTGAAVLLGARAMPNAACVCEIPGEAIALAAHDFLREVGSHPELRDACLRYVAVLLAAGGQAVACSRMHTMVQRCARWLLLAQDRVGKDSFALTHEALGLMLGARRASVTEALGVLARSRLLSSRQGTVEILDRTGLALEACECYAVIHEASEALRGS